MDFTSSYEPAAFREKRSMFKFLENVHIHLSFHKNHTDFQRPGEELKTSRTQSLNKIHSD